MYSGVVQEILKGARYSSEPGTRRGCRDRTGFWLGAKKRGVIFLRIIVSRVGGAFKTSCGRPSADRLGTVSVFFSSEEFVSLSTPAPDYDVVIVLQLVIFTRSERNKYSARTNLFVLKKLDAVDRSHPFMSLLLIST